MNKLRTLADCLKILIIKVVSFFAKPFCPKDIWLISERNGKEARDNAYHLFAYLRREHPEINAVYAIDKNSPDFEKINKLGEFIYAKSIKHYLYYFCAAKLISTHLYGFSPNYKTSDYIDKFLIKAPKYFLQHGVSLCHHNIFNKNKSDLRLFVCSSAPEYDYALESYGYTEREIRLLGMARYDNLHNNNLKKHLLVMPSFRIWLSLCSEQDFIHSEYYKRFQSLINNPELQTMLDKNDYTLLFYPHFQLQHFIHLFTSQSKRVIIASARKYDVQTLLKECVVAVTDYSSIHSDMAYMLKPVIYYQFDEDEFFGHHYEKGNFDFDRDGFGLKTDNEQAVVNELERLFSNDFKMDDKYIKRAESFFPIRDAHNCERIYKAIREA